MYNIVSCIPLMSQSNIKLDISMHFVEKYPCNVPLLDFDYAFHVLQKALSYNNPWKRKNILGIKALLSRTCSSTQPNSLAELLKPF